MRKNFKRILAVLCAAALTTLSVAVAGNLSVLKTAAEVSPAGEISFGEDASYLKLSNPISADSKSVEAEVKMTENIGKTEWSLRAGGDTENIIGGLKVADGTITTGTTTEADVGPAVGSGYIEFRAGSNSLTAYNDNLGLDLSKYETKDLSLAFWVYSEIADRLFTTGSIRISNGTNGSDGEAMLSYQGSAISVNYGWNYIELPLDKFTSLKGFSLDNPISSFRFHGCKVTTAGSERTEKIGEVKLIVNNKEINEWTLRNGGSTENIIGGLKVTDGTITTGTTTEADVGPAVGSNYIEFEAGSNSLTAYNNNLGLDLSKYETKDLSLAFWVYSETADRLFTTGSIRISNGTNGSDGEAMLSYQGSAISVNYGWNYIELPLDKFTSLKGFSLDNPISSFRFHGCKVTTAGSERTEKIGEVKLIANDTDKVFTSNLSGNESVYHNGYSIISNINSETGDTPYALFVTREGKPAFIYNDKLFVLNHNVCTGEFVKIGVTVNDDNTITFTVGDNLTVASTKTFTAVTPVFASAHSIGADAVGGTLMNGSIKNLTVGTDTWTLSANKDYPLNAIKNSDGSNNAHFVGIANSNAPVVVEYANATAGTAPTDAADMDGYVFAGWFTDKDCTKALTGTGKAYAKYVDKAVLTVKAQIKTDAATAESTDMRFVTTVDSLNYKSVGFVINNVDKTLGTVYTKLYAVSNSAQIIEKTPAEVSNTSVSAYFATFTVTNIPKAKYASEFNVTPYWITLDGTRVSGNTVVKSVSQGI